jgi:hypothetical protein
VNFATAGKPLKGLVVYVQKTSSLNAVEEGLKLESRSGVVNTW